MKAIILRQWNQPRTEPTGTVDTANPQDYGWNAGLTIDPTEFSQQLAKLQISLQKANTSPALEKIGMNVSESQLNSI